MLLPAPPGDRNPLGPEGWFSLPSKSSWVDFRFILNSFNAAVPWRLMTPWRELPEALLVGENPEALTLLPYTGILLLATDYFSFGSFVL